MVQLFAAHRGAMDDIHQCIAQFSCFLFAFVRVIAKINPTIPWCQESIATS
eukprot:m.228468 g.228468  ORF g.228468 m.228468 type:complete len:51 (+) comp13878_c0_seq1:182-334(+)